MNNKKYYGVDVDELLAQLGLSGLPEEKKQAYLTKFREIIEARLYSRVMDSITDEDEAACTGKNPEQIIEYFQTKGVDIEGIAIEEAINLGDDIKESMAFVEGMQSQIENRSQEDEQ